MKLSIFDRLSWLLTGMLIASIAFGVYSYYTAPASTPAASAPAASSCPSSAAAAAGQKVKIGFLYVGQTDDFGYNYAADQGRLYLQKTLGDKVDIVTAQNVPENASAEQVMEQMIKDCATIIYATSYGHFDPAVNVSKRHPNIVFLHQGGVEPKQNVSSYYGDIWQMVYSSGVAAGKMTKTNKLGYVVAFPIPQTLLAINAYQLGARSVNPNVTTTVEFTASWCDPAKESAAANKLIDQGADVLMMYQDCPRPVIEVAEKRGVMTTGYHADASPVAPKGWITGAMWNWGPFYTQLAQEAMDGTLQPAQLHLNVKDGVVNLAPFGASVPDDVKKLVSKTKDDLIAGRLTPFQGPIKDQSGSLRIQGPQPDITTLEKTDYLVEGVIGTIPK